MPLPGVAGERTPLPEEGKPAYLCELVTDALQKGAAIVNAAADQTRDWWHVGWHLQCIA